MHVSTTSKARDNFAPGWSGLALLSLVAAALAVLLTGSHARSATSQTFYFSSASFPVKNYRATAWASKTAGATTASVGVSFYREATTGSGESARAPSTQSQNHTFSFTVPAADVAIGANLRFIRIDTGIDMGSYGRIALTAMNLPKAMRQEYPCSVYLKNSGRMSGSVSLNTMTSLFGEVKQDNPRGSVSTNKYRTCPSDCSDGTSTTASGTDTQPDGSSLALAVTRSSHPAGSKQPVPGDPTAVQGGPPPALVVDHYASLNWYENDATTAPASISHSISSTLGELKSVRNNLSSALVAAPGGPGVMLSGDGIFVSDGALSKFSAACGISKTRYGHFTASPGSVAMDAEFSATFDIGGLKVFKGNAASSSYLNRYVTHANP